MYNSQTPDVGIIFIQLTLKMTKQGDLAHDDPFLAHAAAAIGGGYSVTLPVTWRVSEMT